MEQRFTNPAILSKTLSAASAKIQTASHFGIEGPINTAGRCLHGGVPRLGDSHGYLGSGSLKRTQRHDGSWANPENLVKEDDPLIATAFAVRALASQ
jgi:hypothetical protein